MDEYRENVKKVQKALNQDAAFIQPDPYLAQRVLNAAHAVHGKGKTKMRKKLLCLIFVLVLMSITLMAAAAVFMNLHIEKAMDLAKDQGAFQEWALQDKMALIETMAEEGIALPQDQLRILTDASCSEEEKDRAATELLVGIYGNEEYISHFTIASHDWGDPFQWTLEQKAWFWETLRAKGLYTGKIEYLLPEENDLSRDQVVQLAKKAIQDAYHLPDETMRAYDADVKFFTIFGTEQAPRWLIYLGHADAEAADYSILLTRDGQVTEDASLYVFKPEQLAKSEAPVGTQPSAAETPFQKRMSKAEVLYLSLSDGHYHFLPNCPSVKNESMVETENISKTLDECLPCPYCVLTSQLWSVEDKILYNVMYGELPSEKEISAAEAEQRALDHLLSRGIKDAEELVPYLRYIKKDTRYYYEVYFARLENEQVTPIYSVMVDAENGQVCTVKELTGNG